ncbi:MAG: sensor domain-containing diguanylate cyclase [Paracoccaceae bacterium]
MFYKRNPTIQSVPIFSGLGTFEGLFADMPDGVVVSSPERRILWMNAAAEAMYGYEFTELHGKDSAMLYVTEEAHETITQHLVDMRKGAKSAQFSTLFKRKNGAVFEADVTGSPIRSEEGALLGYLGVIRDVSETNAINRVNQALYDISSNHELTPETKLQDIMKLGCAHFGLPTAIISWIEDEIYTVVHSRSALTEIPPGMQFDLGRTYCCHTLAADGPIGFHDAKNSEIAKHPCYADFGLAAYIGIPLIVDGIRFGTLNFSGPEARQAFNTADYDLMKLFAAWVAQELSAAQALAALERRANTDPETGCLNRPAWMRAAQELAHPGAVDTNGAPIAKAVVAFGLDDLKSIKDIHGLRVGESILKEVARLCKADPALKDQPIGRLGGEEFFILLHGKAAQNAADVVDALRNQIAQIAIPLDGQKVGCTASFGLCQFSVPSMTLAVAMNQADLALFEAKSLGCNQVKDAKEISPVGRNSVSK